MKTQPQANNYPIILVVYAGVFDMVTAEDYSFLMDHLDKFMTNQIRGTNAIYFIIPVRENNKIDIKCINPVLVSQEEYSKAASLLEQCKDAAKQYLEEIKKNKRR